MMSRLTILLSAAFALLLFGCSGQDYDRVGKTSTVTGLSYGDETNFEPQYYEGQDAAPGLVFIEGGTFHMGGSEKDIAYDMDNHTRQVTVSSFYIDRTEIANVHYKEFLNFVKNNGRQYSGDSLTAGSSKFPLKVPTGEDYYSQLSNDKLYEKLYPDTTVWYRSLAYNDPYIQYYFSHPGFNMYPVVGISWYQAHEFCKWRTYVVNSKMKEDDPEAITYPKYRLPTEAEWEYAARGLLEQQLYPWEGKSLRNLDGRFRANFKRGRGDFAGRSDKGGSELTGGLNDAYMITAPVRAEFQPNDFGLYHMAGNVAEWTEDTYRVLAYEDVQDLNPFRRRGQTQDPWKEDSQYPTNESGDLSLLYNPGTDNDPGAGSGNAEQHNRVKVYRGGSWNDVAYYLSCGSRRYLNADSSLATVGFRCAMTRVGSPELD